MLPQIERWIEGLNDRLSTEERPPFDGGCLVKVDGHIKRVLWGCWQVVDYATRDVLYLARESSPNSVGLKERAQVLRVVLSNFGMPIEHPFMVRLMLTIAQGWASEHHSLISISLPEASGDKPDAIAIRGDLRVVRCGGVWWSQNGERVEVDRSWEVYEW